ncbi:MAG: hypothetical protein IVW55_01415 [Chloroflexi bacterium]|nr:hypothetical protein [Chloroflexota bacterium]
MIFVIVPLGKEAKEVRDWVVRVAMYTAASTLGAGLLAMLLGFIGHQFFLLSGITLPWVAGVLGIISILYALRELKILHLPVPQVGWQVPKSWMRRSRLEGNILYGLVLGAGVLTFIPYASFLVLLAWEFVAGAVSLKAAVLLGMLYGASRGLPAALGGISVLRGDYPLPLSEWIIARMGLWHAINGLALLLIGAYLLGSLVL